MPVKAYMSMDTQANRDGLIGKKKKKKTTSV